MATAETTRVLHPGEGGYDEALVEWDLQQNPDREPAVSTPSGRQEAMALVHTMAESPKHDVSAAIASINDPEASGEALRHVLVGGVHSVEDFAVEVAEAEGGEPLPAHRGHEDHRRGAHRARFLGRCTRARLGPLLRRKDLLESLQAGRHGLKHRIIPVDPRPAISKGIGGFPPSRGHSQRPR